MLPVRKTQRLHVPVLGYFQRACFCKTIYKNNVIFSRNEETFSHTLFYELFLRFLFFSERKKKGDLETCQGGKERSLRKKRQRIGMNQTMHELRKFIDNLLQVCVKMFLAWKKTLPFLFYFFFAIWAEKLKQKEKQTAVGNIVRLSVNSWPLSLLTFICPKSCHVASEMFLDCRAKKEKEEQDLAAIEWARRNPGEFSKRSGGKEVLLDEDGLPITPWQAELRQRSDSKSSDTDVKT